MTAQLAAAILTGIAGIITALSIGFTRIIKEMRPNGGNNLRDTVNRINQKVDELTLAVAKLQAQTTKPGSPRKRLPRG